MKHFNLSAWALNHRAFVRYLMVVLMAAGIFSYFNLGQQEDPDFTFKVMFVRVNWPGATAREMEQQITDKIEKKLQETPWLDNIRSYSKPGEAVIFIELKESVAKKDVPTAWYQVRKKVGDIRHQLPSEVQGPFFNDEFGDTFGSIFAFTSDGFNYAQTKDYVDKVRQELLRLDNVAKVDIVGEQEEKIFIEYSNKKVAALGLDPVTIASVLAQQNAMDSAGQIITPQNLTQLRVSGDFKSVEAIRDIGIRANGRSFRLGDIAHVYRGYIDPPTFKMRYKGKDAIGLALSMTAGGNVIQLGKDIASTMQRLKTELPVGIEVHQVSDQPRVVTHSVNEFMQTLLEAIVIVLAVSFISLGLRTGLVVALSIPLVLSVTFLVMLIVKIDLQRISLGALIIALGLLVDDAMIAVEMMALKLEQGWDKVRAATFAYSSTAFPMLTGTLITAAAFLPVGLARSNAGEYTFSIFAVVGISLLVSWVVAVLFIPYLGTWLLKSHPQAGEIHIDIYQRPFYQRFRNMVTWCVRYRKTVIIFTAGVFIASILGFKLFVEQQFFPSSNRPELLVDLWLAEDVSFHTTAQEVKQVESLLADDKNIDNYVAYIGGGSPRFYLPLDQQQPNLNYAQFVVMTKGLVEREMVKKKLENAFKQGFPSVRGRVVRLENGPPVGYPVQFRITGTDPERLRLIAKDVENVMRSHPNTRDVNNDWNEKIKVVKLDLDQDKARALGVSTQQLSRTLAGMLNGMVVTDYREGDKRIQVIARAIASERTILEQLQYHNVQSSLGKALPLAQLASVSYGFEDGLIRRRDRYPTITVRADISDGVQAPDVTMQLNPKLDAIRAKLPDGYRIDIGGALEASGKSQKSIAAVVPLMIFVIVTLLMIQLQSFQRTVLVLLTAPLGMIGVTLFLLLFQKPFGFVAMLGVIALMGMIMRNSVILVDQIEQDRQEGHSAWQAIIESTVRRFRPIMLTALAAILAMIPLSRSTFWGPMAIAIMGGLLVATVLTLFFLPALYAAWFRVSPSEKSM